MYAVFQPAHFYYFYSNCCGSGANGCVGMSYTPKDCYLDQVVVKFGVDIHTHASNNDTFYSGSPIFHKFMVSTSCFFIVLAGKPNQFHHKKQVKAMVMGRPQKVNCQIGIEAMLVMVIVIVIVIVTGVLF